MSILYDVRDACRHFARYVRWNPAPERGAGIGGLLGEGEGAVNFEYTNWLYGYRDAAKALTLGHERPVRGWAAHWQSRRPNAGGGIDKALWVWDRLVPSPVRRLVGSTPGRGTDEQTALVELQSRVVLDLDTHVQLELARLGARGPVKLVRGTALGPSGYYLRPPRL